MKPDHFGHRAGHTITKMTPNCVFNHLAQFLEGFTLGYDGVPQRRGHVAAIHFVFLNFENNFAHRSNLAGYFNRSNPPARP